MIARSLPARLAASAVLAGVLLASASGCTLIATQATYLPYEAADGVNADLGDLLVRDVRAVVGEDGLAIALVFTAINTGDSRATLTLGYEGANGPGELTVPVGPGKSVSVGRPGDVAEAVVLFPGKIVPGQNFEVYVQAGSADGVLLSVPVFDATNPLYAELAPAPVAR